MNGGVKLPFGLLDGMLVHISCVERGLKCLCHCPGCNARLVAKKGEIAQHHFAHSTETDCTYRPETALHNYAKQLISQQHTFHLPTLNVVIQRKELGMRFQEAVEGATVSIRRAVQEHRYHDVVPDVQLETDSGLVFVEVAVTHFVDHEKRKKLALAVIPTVEIDLSSIPLDAHIQLMDQAILHDESRRKWAFHPREAELRGRLEQQLRTALDRLEQDRYREYDDVIDDEIGEDEDGEGWRLLEKAEDYANDTSLTDSILRDAPRDKRLNLYKSMSDAEKLAYHCYLLRMQPRKLPSFFNTFDGGVPQFSCPSIVWRTGTFVRFVAHNLKPFTVGHVVDWCRDRYDVFSYGVGADDDTSRLSLTMIETEVFDFMAELERGGYLESDGFIAKLRRFTPTGKRILGR